MLICGISSHLVPLIKPWLKYRHFRQSFIEPYSYLRLNQYNKVSTTSDLLNIKCALFNKSRCIFLFNCAVIKNKDESGSLYIYNYAVIILVILDLKLISFVPLIHS